MKRLSPLPKLEAAITLFGCALCVACSPGDLDTQWRPGPADAAIADAAAWNVPMLDATDRVSAIEADGAAPADARVGADSNRPNLADLARPDVGVDASAPTSRDLGASVGGVNFLETWQGAADLKGNSGAFDDVRSNPYCDVVVVRNPLPGVTDGEDWLEHKTKSDDQAPQSNGTYRYYRSEMVFGKNTSVDILKKESGSKSNRLGHGVNYFYQFAFIVAEHAWDKGWSSGAIHQLYPTTPVGIAGGNPMLSIRIGPDRKLNYVVRHNAAYNEFGDVTEVWSAGGSGLGPEIRTKHVYILRVQWVGSWQKKGTVRIWLDGKLLVDKTQISTAYNADNGPALKWGLYTVNFKALSNWTHDWKSDPPAAFRLYTRDFRIAESNTLPSGWPTSWK